MSAPKTIHRPPSTVPPCDDGHGHTWQEAEDPTPATTFERCVHCGLRRITTVRYARPESQWVLAKEGHR